MRWGGKAGAVSTPEATGAGLGRQPPRGPMKLKILLLTVPAVLLVVFAALYRQEADGSAHRAALEQARTLHSGAQHRLVVVIVDSLRRATLEAPGVMPHLLALARDAGTHAFPLLTCGAGFTLPCLQTLMEGRQSPFVAGLHNFTGMEGGDTSIARSLSAAGVRLAIVGDHTLLDLYGRHAAWTWGVESVPGDPLQRDLAAVGRAAELLDRQPQMDALFLHVPGTDKAAHHKRPGTAAYDEHHRRVDEALVEIWRQVDPARDDLIVMGDHGHDERGDHTRASLVLMRGPRLTALLSGLAAVPGEIAQEELIYFMSFPFALPLPPAYEGRFYLSRAAAGLDDPHAAPDALRRFEEAQRLALRDVGEADSPLAAKVALRAAGRHAMPHELFLRLLPLFPLALLWGLWFFAGRVGPDGRALAATGVSCVAAAGLFLAGAPGGGPVLTALGLAACVLTVGIRRAWRPAVFLLVVLAGAGLMGFYARDWAELMHTRDGLSLQAVLFHLLLPLAGAGLAWLRFGRLARFPEGMGLIGLLLLPSGVYYYQSGRNLLLGYALGEALLLLGRALRVLRPGGRGGPADDDRPAGWRRAAAGSVFAFAVGVVLCQEAGGWEWGLWYVHRLQGAPRWVAEVCFWAAGGLVAGWARGAPARTLLLSVLGLTRVYSVGLGGLDLPAAAAAWVGVLLLAAVLELDPDVPAAAPSGRESGVFDGAVARDALLLTGVMTWMLWVQVRGFFITHVDYHFAFDLFGDFAREGPQALAFAAATVLKYGLPLVFAILAYRCRKGAGATARALAGVLFLLQLKLITLLLQALLVPLATAEKLGELAVADLAFVLGILLTVALTCLALWLVERGAAAFGPTPATSAPAGVRPGGR